MKCYNCCVVGSEAVSYCWECWKEILKKNRELNTQNKKLKAELESMHKITLEIMRERDELKKKFTGE